MDSERVEGRRIGILMLLQMASALILPFVLFGALAKGYPPYMDTVAENAAYVRAGVLVSFFGAGLTLALGIFMLPVLRRHSQAAAIFFLMLCAVSCTLDAVQDGTVLSMLSVGVKYANAGGADTPLYQAWGAMASSIRLSVHIVQLFAVGAWMFTFYLGLFRYRLVPRALAGLGIAGVLSQFTGVTLMMFLGDSPITYLAMPLGPIHAIVAIWLIVKGIGPQQTSSVPDQTFDRG